MKRLINLRPVAGAVLSAMLVFSATTGMSAGEKVSGDTPIPPDVKSFVLEYLGGEKIAKGKPDKDEYKIRCVSGTKVEFDMKGRWKEIKNEKTGIPASAVKVLPNAAVLYLQNNYNGVAVKKIERKVDGYLVELGTTPGESRILFAKEGNVKKIMNND